MSTKRRREKKETLSIDRSKLWNGGLVVYPVAIGVTIVPLQAALALTRRMLKFRTGTLPHKWAVIVFEGDMSSWAWSVILKISQVEIAKSSEPQVQIFYANKITRNNHYIKMDLGIKRIVFIFTKSLLPPSIFLRLIAPQKGFQPILYLSILEVHTYCTS
mgnify:CR=1 FL=1